MAPRYNINCYSSFADLPSGMDSLIQSGIEQHGLYRDPAWFDHLMRHFFDEDIEMRLYTVEETASKIPLLLVPMRYTRTDQAASGANVVGMISHPENYSTAPFIFSPTATDHADILKALFDHLKSGDPKYSPMKIDAIRIWPAEATSSLGDLILSSLIQAGFRVQMYNNSHNQFEVTEGIAYAEYFQRRSANMRYGIRRWHRALEKKGRLEFHLATRQDQLDTAVSDYMKVSNASWKEPASMYSIEAIQLMGLCAQKGTLRLGILRLDGIPIAAQFWIVTGSTALCARLAYHEDYKKLGPGVVLTHFMLEHILDQDHPASIDFGYGPDEYKSRWMDSNRTYYGFMAFNPDTLQGRLQAAKNIYGSAAKQLTKRLLGKLGIRRFQG